MRSKTTLTANIIMTVYFLGMVCLVFYGFIIELEPTPSKVDPFELATSIETLRTRPEDVFLGLMLLFFVLITFFVHTVLTFVSLIFGWIGYITKKCGLTKTFAIINLLAAFTGLIFFPFGFIFPLVSSILGFSSAKKQKEVNAVEESVIM